MVEPYTIASKFYADDAIQAAIRDKKSFAEMEQFAVSCTSDLALRKYFIDGLREALCD